MITDFDRTTTRLFLQELEAVAKDLAAKHGVIVMPGRSQFSGQTLKAGLEFHVPAGTTSAVPSTLLHQVGQSPALMRAAAAHGFDPAKVGPNGARLVDYKAQNHRYPWIVLKQGKRWKWPTEMARAAFGPLGGLTLPPATSPIWKEGVSGAPTQPPTLDSTVPATMPKRNGTTGTYEAEF